MHEVTVHTRLRVPATRVYDFLVDNRNDPLWCPLASDVELVEGEPGSGAVYRYRQGQGPGRQAMAAWLRTITAERPRRLVWDNADRGLPYEARIDLVERDGVTFLRHTNRVTLPSRPEQLLWWLLAHVVLRLQLRNLRRELRR